MGKTRLTRWQVSGYGVASMGTGIFSALPGLILMFYMTNVLAIPAGLAALGVFLPKLWDVISDPLMGWITDRTTGKLGPRRPYLFAGSVILGLSFISLFNVPAFEDPFSRLLYVMGAFVFCATGYTVFSVPYISMPIDMELNYHERTRIQAWRMAFLMLGILAAGTMPVLVDMMGGGEAGYSLASLVIAMIITGSMLITAVQTRWVNIPRPPLTSPDFRFLFSSIMRNRPFLLLAFSYVVQLSGLVCFTAALPYAAIYLLDFGSVGVTTIFLSFYLAGMLSIGFWQMVSRRCGKHAAAMTSALVLGFAYLSLAIDSLNTSVSIVLLIVMLAGVGLAGQQTILFAMLTDAVSDKRETTFAGIYCGIWTAIEKMGLAFGALVAGACLHLGGYRESSTGQKVTQDEAALAAINLAYSVIPAVLVFTGAFILWQYRAHDKRLKLASSGSAV